MWAIVGRGGAITDGGRAPKEKDFPQIQSLLKINAVPAGNYNGGFNNRGQNVNYWSSSPYDSGNAWEREWNYNNAGVNREYDNKENAIAVRCLRN